jgi:hypothetical protein
VNNPIGGEGGGIILGLDLSGVVDLLEGLILSVARKGGREKWRQNERCTLILIVVEMNGINLRLSNAFVLNVKGI